MLLLLTLVAAAIYFVVKYYRVKMRPLIEKAEKIPGPRTIPLIGNALDFGTSTKRTIHLFLDKHAYCQTREPVTVLHY
jgi:hypothetical protein